MGLTKISEEDLSNIFSKELTEFMKSQKFMSKNDINSDDNKRKIKAASKVKDKTD